MKTEKIFRCITIFIYISIVIVSPRNNLEAGKITKGLFLKSSSLVKISLGYVKLKKYGMANAALGAAYKIALNMDEQFSRTIILYEITDKYIILNKNQDALRVAEAIEFADVKYDAFSNIAYRYVEQGKFNTATDVVKKIKDNFTKALWLYKIVNKLTEIGLYEEAVKMTKAINSQRPIYSDLIDNSLTDIKFEPQSKSLNEPYQEARRLIDAADQYFSVILYEPAKALLSKAVLISKDIKQESLRKDVLFRKDIVNGKINNFQKYYKLNYEKY